MEVATIFLSKRKGAIYFALSEEDHRGYLPARGARNGEALAYVDFNYEDVQDHEKISDRSTCRLLGRENVQVGLTRGKHLVDEYLTLKKAAQVHLFENNQQRAFELVNGLFGRLQRAGDPALDPERELVGNINQSLALLSGNVGAVESADPKKGDPAIVGVWRQLGEQMYDDSEVYLIVWANGVIESVLVDSDSRETEFLGSMAVAGPIPTGRRGIIPVETDLGSDDGFRYRVSGGSLRLDLSQTVYTPLHDLVMDSRKIAFERSTYADMISGSKGKTAAELDSLSGLPVSRALANTDTSTRRLNR
jgi:hypothetical protein